MEDASTTTAMVLPVLRVVWRHVWRHEAAQDTPPVYLVQSHAGYPCPCGQTEVCSSPHGPCPNGKHGAFTVTRKTRLVSLSLVGAQQCARNALLEMLGDEFEEVFETSIILTGIDEGERMPAWLGGVIRDKDDMCFYTWTEQSAGGVEQPTAYVVTVRQVRLACATKAQLRGSCCDESSLVGQTQSQLRV